ncbi:MAG: hypothetical protein JXR56_05395 [Candidatus Cloacimonetes bacterium]|nr:hypothetical protein [Candidatus Cloacimonadota bacterium]
MKSTKALLLVLTMLLFLGIMHAQPYYVSTAGHNDTGDGTSGNPFRTIQFAINTAIDANESSIEIYLGYGEYVESFVNYNPDI